MNLGRVHVWVHDPEAPLGGRVETRVEPLAHLDGDGRLAGKFVRVRNAGWVNEPLADGPGHEPRPLGDAVADANGDFLFEHGRGGPRVDKYRLRSEKYRRRYVAASRFGEVNAYYHVDRIACYVDELLQELGAPPLPPVVAVVNAHHAAVLRGDGRDGEWREDRWVPFQGGHYRLPNPRNRVRELDPVALDGEIHFGPGRRVLDHGALFDAAGRYRHHAAHNAGVIYHEYGHHVSRHTADFRANAHRSRSRQSNAKAALDEGFSDYWAATLLGVPHIWVWHHSHRREPAHARNLTSTRTLADFDGVPDADPHARGTLWSASLWDLRSHLAASSPDGPRLADKLVLESLLRLGRMPEEPATRREIERMRGDFSVALDALLEADERLAGGSLRAEILAAFGRRGIRLGSPWQRFPRTAGGTPGGISEIAPDSPLLRRMRARVASEDIPETGDLFSAPALDSRLSSLREPPYSLMAVGDVMLGARARRVIAKHGPDHLFAAVAPLLARARVVLGNLEGPLAEHAPREPRHHSYRVSPFMAPVMARAGFGVMTLANNHLLDCGRAGVMETLAALAAADIAVVGAGGDRKAAHVPAVFEADGLSIGVLGYYWNRRTAATGKLPGSAMGTPESLRADLMALRERVDRVIVTFHWGIPYEREPLPTDRDLAHLAVDLGADVVIGHHAHVVQPFEVYAGCPIFYGIGNFVFGSGNSKAEGLIVGLRFGAERTRAEIYPLYVKNRDPRVQYQPKVMRGAAAARFLSRLVQVSGSSGDLLLLDTFRAVLELPWASRGGGRSTARVG